MQQMTNLMSQHQPQFVIRRVNRRDETSVNEDLPWSEVGHERVRDGIGDYDVLPRAFAHTKLAAPVRYLFLDAVYTFGRKGSVVLALVGTEGGEAGLDLGFYEHARTLDYLLAYIFHSVMERVVSRKHFRFLWLLGTPCLVGLAHD